MWQAWLASVSVLSIIWRQFFSSGCLSVPPPPTAPAALWRRTGSTWRSPWTTSTRRQRPQPAAVPAVLCIHAVATTGYVQQPSICDAGNIMMLHTAIIKKVFTIGCAQMQQYYASMGQQYPGGPPAPPPPMYQGGPPGEEQSAEWILTPKLKLVEETASTCKFWDFRVQEVIIQRFLISEVKHQDFNMDLGDLVASAEQLTAEIDGVRVKIYFYWISSYDFRREQAICHEWRGAWSTFLKQGTAFLARLAVAAMLRW